jgi:hypothetical protein
MDSEVVPVVAVVVGYPWVTLGVDAIMHRQLIPGRASLDAEPFHVLQDRRVGYIELFAYFGR